MFQRDINSKQSLSSLLGAKLQLLISLSNALFLLNANRCCKASPVRQCSSFKRLNRLPDEDIYVFIHGPILISKADCPLIWQLFLFRFHRAKMRKMKNLRVLLFGSAGTEICFSLSSSSSSHFFLSRSALRTWWGNNMCQIMLFTSLSSQPPAHKIFPHVLVQCAITSTQTFLMCFLFQSMGQCSLFALVSTGSFMQETVWFLQWNFVTFHLILTENIKTKITCLLLLDIIITSASTTQSLSFIQQQQSTTGHLRYSC